MAKLKTGRTPAIETVNIGAAAVDIGSREHLVAVNPDVTDAPVRSFSTFTPDLHNLADWFKSHGVTCVAMESTGVTGMKISRAIVEGERNGCIGSYRGVRSRASTETIKAALNGNYRPEHVFALTQSLELYDFYQVKMLECDRLLEAVLGTLAAVTIGRSDTALGAF